MNFIQCPAGEHCLRVRRGACLMWHPPRTANLDKKKTHKRVRSFSIPDKKYNTRRHTNKSQKYSKTSWEQSTPKQKQDSVFEEKILEDIFKLRKEDDADEDEKDVFYDSYMDPSEIEKDNDEECDDKLCEQNDKIMDTDIVTPTTTTDRNVPKINLTQTTKKIYNLNCIYGDRKQYLATGLKNTNVGDKNC